MAESSIRSRFGAELIGQVLGAISGAILIFLLARLLNPTEYGLLFLTISIVGIGNLFARLGIPKSTSKYIAQYKTQNPEQLPDIIRSGLFLNLSALFVTVVSLLIGHRFLSDFLDEPAIRPLLIIGAIYILFYTLMNFFRMVLQGYELNEMSSTVYALDQIGRLIFTTILVLLGFNSVGALFGYTLASAVATLVGLIFVAKNIYYPNKEPGDIRHSLRKRIGKYALPLTATDAANKLDKRVDTILVGYFLSPTYVSFYVIGKQVSTFVEKPVAALGYTISPTLGSKKSEGDIKQAKELYENSLLYSLLLYIPAAAGLFIISNPMVDVLFGQEYIEAVPVLQIFSIYIIAHSITYITSSSLDYLGRARIRAIIRSISSILNFGLNLFFIPKFGITGAAAVTVVTYSLYTLGTLYMIDIELDLRKRTILKNVTKICLITAIMSIIVIQLSTYINGILSLFAVVTVGISIWVCLSTVSGFLRIGEIKSAFA